MQQDPETLAALLATGRDPATAPVTLAAEAYPATLDAAYRLQDRVVALLGAASGGRPAGYKIGASSERAQRYLGLSEPFFGQVLTSGLLASPATLPAAAFRFRLVEPEFAFTLGRDLPPRAAPYGEDEVADAVALLHPAIEIVASAFDAETWHKASGRALICDNGVHGRLILGQGRADWRRFDLPSHRVELWIDGKSAGEGTGANAFGHPLRALTWLARQQAQSGRGLRAGEVVTTGVVTPFVMVEAGQEARADFGPLGVCSVSFTD